MAVTKRASAARDGERKTGTAEGNIYDPTAAILDQYKAEYVAFERHKYAKLPRQHRFGGSTVALPFRGEPEASGEAFNPLRTLGRRR